MRFVCMLAIAVMASAAGAQSVKLSADEISVLLSGNTATGARGGTTYQQYFGADGVTVLALDDAEPTQGAWRVDAQADEYQSRWPGDANWEGWFIMEYAGVWYWVSKTTPPTAFEVLEGQQVKGE